MTDKSCVVGRRRKSLHSVWLTNSRVFKRYVDVRWVSSLAVGTLPSLSGCTSPCEGETEVEDNKRMWGTKSL